MSIIDFIIGMLASEDVIDLYFVATGTKPVHITERERIEGGAFDSGAQAAQDGNDRSRSGKYPV